MGFCGALTTFSTLALETWVFYEERRWRPFVANLCLSLGVGGVAVVLGFWAGSAL
jgi:CrcB protein